MCRLPFIQFISLALLFCSATVYSFGAKDWDFVLLRIEYNTSDAEIVDFNMRAVRASQGVYALNGSITIGNDIDDKYSVSLKVYRSASGSSQYKSTPFEIAKSSFYKFMTTIYVKMLQEDLSKCTNVPQYESQFDKPLAKGIYNFDKCIITNEGMPGHMQPGHYKVTGSLSDDKGLQLWVSLFFEVNTKSVG